MTAQVFISYKSEYRDFAKKLRDQLRVWGFGTWLDQDDIREGTNFRHENQKGLESSTIVVGILTPEALQSREVMWEWDYALRHSRFIPVKFRDCALPYHLEGTQYVDFIRDEVAGFQRLQQTLNTPRSGVVRPVSRSDRRTETRRSADTEGGNRARMLQKVKEFWIEGCWKNRCIRASFTWAWKPNRTLFYATLITAIMRCPAAPTLAIFLRICSGNY